MECENWIDDFKDAPIGATCIPTDSDTVWTKVEPTIYVQNDLATEELRASRSNRILVDEEKTISQRWFDKFMKKEKEKE